MMASRPRLGAITSVLIVALLMAGGCHTAPEQTPQDQKVDTLVKQAGGDWTRLSESDRTTLTQDLGHGNARTAQMGFQARWSRLQGGKNAAPPPHPGMPQ